MKKNVLTNKGFTLLEALMSMFVMTFLTFLILQWVNIIGTTTVNFEHQKQIIIMTNYVQNDFIGIQKYNILNNKVELIDFNNETISYELRDKKIIRQKNNKGYEVLVTGVDKINFTKSTIGNYITMEVIFSDQEKIETILSSNYV